MWSCVLLCFNFNYIVMDTYRWETDYEHSNNEETMSDYLNNHLSDNFDVFFIDGAYAEMQDKSNGKIWAVNASGDGDFRHHKVEFEFIP